MATESDLADVDPLDFRSALVAFLGEVRWIAKAWRPGVEAGDWGVAAVEVSAGRALAAGFTLAEHAPTSFPVRDFTVGLLESVRRVENAAFGIRMIVANPDEFPDDGESEREEREKLGDAWRQVRVHYCAMQDFLRVTEVRAGVGQMSRGEWKLEPPEAPAVPEPSEVAPRPSDQAPDVETTAKALPLSVAEAGQEWDRVIKAMKKDAVADGSTFDPDDVTDEVAYRRLEELYTDEGKGKKPSQAFATWRKYVGMFRKAAGNPKRRPGPR